MPPFQFALLFCLKGYTLQQPFQEIVEVEKAVHFKCPQVVYYACPMTGAV